MDCKYRRARNLLTSSFPITHYKQHLFTVNIHKIKQTNYLFPEDLKLLETIKKKVPPLSSFTLQTLVALWLLKGNQQAALSPRNEHTTEIPHFATELQAATQSVSDVKLLYVKILSNNTFPAAAVL